MQEGTLIDLPGTSSGMNFDWVREKAQTFLKEYENDPVIRKLRFNEPLNEDNLIALGVISVKAGSSAEELKIAIKETDSLGLFVRSLVGLDREAAKAALSDFMRGKTLTANQIEFTNLILNHLSSMGWIELPRLYASPYMDIHPYGLDGIFDERSTLALLSALQSVRRNASGVSITN